MKNLSFLIAFFCILALNSVKAQQCSAGFTFLSNGLTVNFTDSSWANGGIGSWEWDFGDSTTSTLQNPSHTYVQSGTYWVCLSISNIARTCTNSYCDTVQVFGPPPACTEFAFNDSIVDDTCGSVGGSIDIVNINGGNPPYSYDWSSGDTGSSLINLPPGNYTVTITDDNGCDTIMTYSVKSIVLPNFTYQLDSNGLAQFTSTGGGVGSTYSWSFGDSSFSILSSPNHTYAQSGTYQVCLSITDSNAVSCTFCDSVTVNIADPPKCDAGFSYAIDSTNTAIFTNTSTPIIGSTFNWNFGDGDSSSLTDPIHTYAFPGMYVVTLTMEDSNLNVCDFSDTIVIEFPAPCTAGFSVRIDTDSVFITSSAINYSDIKYYFGDGDSSNLIDPTHVYQRSGTYVICQIVSDTSKNCQDTICDTVVITIPVPCKAGFSYSANGDTVFFKNEASNFTKVIYEFGDGDSSSQTDPFHVYSQSGTYIVKQKIYNELTACEDSLIDTIQVSLSNACMASYQRTVDTTLTSRLFLLNTSTKFATHEYTWTFGDGTTAGVRTPTHRYQNRGTYQICLTVEDDSLNCISTFCDSLEIDNNTSKLIRVIDQLNKNEPKGPLFENLTVFPNPFAEQIIISIENISNENEVEYTIYDMRGLPMKEGKINQEESLIELRHLKSGIYLLLLEDERDSELRRIIKR